ncbi:MAG: bifunctional DNA-formamidopyrimidine glycosylase/DNA-(apurinic or apyrimidinic site) lyase [SAR324 cluster bacterium]|nr:bifunctional DNA-formamidopyrimidine glycosylase/DNA-(apurinic or apyrimidinic site) lyase [SAR324 cluster bacterium]
MPELPEVETIVRELRPMVTGRTVVDVAVFRADALGSLGPDEFRAALCGKRILNVTRRGKFLIFELSPAGYLICHLRMTGKFAVTTAPARPERHHRVWFHLDDGSVMIFQDMRCFGTLAVVERLPDAPSLAKLGMDPLSRGFSLKWLAGALGRSKSPLKHWLMDQTKIAGLGNIYTAEILFRAGLSPLRPACQVGDEETAQLHRATREVLRRAIRKNGTTISDFRRVDEKTGEFQNFLRVYGKEREPCLSCHTPIAKIRQQQRSTFYCPSCQT